MTTSAAPDPEDLTARARIRDAALREFGELGYERATIRGIAERAGVSSGLLRHHYGSKQELRDACDEFLARTVRKLNDQLRADTTLSEVNYVAAARAAIGVYQPYFARALTDGSAAPLFDQMVDLTEEWLAALDAQRPEPPDVPRRHRATVVTAMSLSVSALHQHVSRGLGVDVFSPGGDYALARALIDIYSHPLLSIEDAALARAGLERFHAVRHQQDTETTGQETTRGQDDDD